MFKKTIAAFLLTLALCLFFFRQPDCQFQKISSYKDIPIQSIECPNHLVLFDVDDTLLWLPWPEFTWPFRLKVLWHFPEFVNAQRWELVYSKLWKEAQFTLIDSEAVNLIDKFKSNGCMVLGLTSMESGSYGVIPSMPEWRYKSLKSHGIEFTRKFGNHIFTNLSAYRGDHPALYKGILCANQQSKGKVLEAFLSTLDVLPQQIIAFDDQQEALESIQTACEALHIPVMCYQYTGAQRLEKWDANRMIQEIHVMVN